MRSTSLVPEKVGEPTDAEEAAHIEWVPLSRVLDLVGRARSSVRDDARGNVPRPRTRQAIGEYLDYW